MEKRKGLRVAMSAAMALAGLEGLVSKANADIFIKTEISRTNPGCEKTPLEGPCKLIADGSTIYQMNVRVDTTDHPAARINFSGWNINVPNYIEIVEATLPNGTFELPIYCEEGPSGNENDFFSPQPLPEPPFNGKMNPTSNCVTSDVIEEKLSGNIRNIDVTNKEDFYRGPSDRDFSNGLLGVYYFRVNEGTLPQSGNFNMNAVAFYDNNSQQYLDCATQDCCGYPEYCDNLIDISNDTYTIVAPGCLEDLDGSGRVEAYDLAILLGGWGPNPGDPADFDNDDDVDAADLAQLLGSWGPCP